MKTKELIRAKVSIMPSSLYCPDETDFNGSFMEDQIREYSQKMYDRWFYSHSEKWRKENSSLKGANRQKYVQLWFFEPTGENKISNWFDYGIDGYEELYFWKPLTNFIPVEIFKGYKEGDTVTFELPIEKDLFRETLEKRRVWRIDFEKRYGCKPPTDKEVDEACPIVDNDETRVITWIKVSTILSQKDGSYSSFGSFHEILSDKGAWTPTTVPSYSDCKERILQLQDYIQNHY